MAAKSQTHSRKSLHEGQSIIEFLLMLPLMAGMVVTLIKVNTAIQVSIVNQQYARGQALHLAFNSPVYPELRFRSGAKDDFTENGRNMMIIGVGDNVAQDELEYVPESTHITIAKGGAAKSGANTGVTTQRSQGFVRIRTAVALCTQSNIIKSQNGMVPLDDITNNGVDFRYCEYPGMEGGS